MAIVVLGVHDLAHGELGMCVDPAFHHLRFPHHRVLGIAERNGRGCGVEREMVQRVCDQLDLGVVLWVAVVNGCFMQLVFSPILRPARCG